MLITEFFAGKNIFITGGSGFVGKVLIEKLLRSCPDVGNIYLLIRSNKGLTPQERLKVIKDNALFNKLKEFNPAALEKLVAVQGDLSDLRLGISDADRQLLIEKVNIVYNSAASVRFDDSLKHSININVRSTRNVIELASEIKNLSVFIHISTTYCNTDKQIIEEKIYPSHGNWRDSIRFTEEADPTVVEVLTQKLMKPLANTYTYSKSLAEHVVLDLCKGKLPAAIVRPSVVVPIMKEPIPGWTDNLNGPTALLLAGGKGLIKICWGYPEGLQDYVPADAMVKYLITITREKALSGDINDIEVYNAGNCSDYPITHRELIDTGHRIVWDVSFSKMLSFPNCSITSCYYYYYIQVLLFHLIPAFFLDTILRIIGKKAMLFAIQRKIYIANIVLVYYIKNSWKFVNNKAFDINKKLSEAERKSFGLDDLMYWDEKILYEYLKNCLISSALYIFREKLDQKKDNTTLWRLWILHLFMRFVAGAILVWIVFIKLDIINVGLNYFRNYIEHL